MNPGPLDLQLEHNRMILSIPQWRERREHPDSARMVAVYLHRANEIRAQLENSDNPYAKNYLPGCLLDGETCNSRSYLDRVTQKVSA
jgi:hypothetical protein